MEDQTLPKVARVEALIEAQDARQDRFEAAVATRFNSLNTKVDTLLAAHNMAIGAYKLGHVLSAIVGGIIAAVGTLWARHP